MNKGQVFLVDTEINPHRTQISDHKGHGIFLKKFTEGDLFFYYLTVKGRGKIKCSEDLRKVMGVIVKIVG